MEPDKELEALKTEYWNVYRELVMAKQRINDAQDDVSRAQTTLFDACTHVDQLEATLKMVADEIADLLA